MQTIEFFFFLQILSCFFIILQILFDTGFNVKRNKNICSKKWQADNVCVSLFDAAERSFFSDRTVHFFHSYTNRTLAVRDQLFFWQEERGEDLSLKGVFYFFAISPN